jgi:hypothetical protein
MSSPHAVLDGIVGQAGRARREQTVAALDLIGPVLLRVRAPWSDVEDLQAAVVAALAADRHEQLALGIDSARHVVIDVRARLGAVAGDVVRPVEAKVERVDVGDVDVVGAAAVVAAIAETILEELGVLDGQRPRGAAEDAVLVVVDPAAAHGEALGLDADAGRVLAVVGGDVRAHQLQVLDRHVVRRDHVDALVRGGMVRVGEIDRGLLAGTAQCEPRHRDGAAIVIDAGGNLDHVVRRGLGHGCARRGVGLAWTDAQGCGSGALWQK